MRVESFEALHLIERYSSGVWASFALCFAYDASREQRGKLGWEWSG